MNRLLRKEFLAITRDGRLLAAGTALFVVLGGFFLAADIEHRQRLAERQSVEQQVRAQWDNQGEKGAHSGAHFGLYAFTPHTGLGSVDPGIQRYNGQAVWLEPHKRNLPRFGEASEHGPILRLGEMTAGFVLYALVPLLVLSLAHGSVSGEREQGTLRMLYSLGLNGRQLLLSKLVGITAGLFLIVLPALMSGLWLLGVAGAPDGDAMLRSASLLVALLLYYGVFAALALAVSARLPTSRMTLLVLLAAWVAGVVIAPRLAASFAQAISPLPTADAFWSAIRNDIDHGLGNDGDRRTRAAHFEQAVLKEYGVGHLEELPVGFPALLRNFNESYAKKVHDHHFDALYDHMELQKNQVLWASLLGPATAMRMLSMSLCGTDLNHQRHFENAAEAYRIYVIDLSDDWDATRTRGLTGGGMAGGADWRSVRSFEYSPPGVGFALRSAWREWLILMAWLAVSLGFLLSSARRLNP